MLLALGGVGATVAAMYSQGFARKLGWTVVVLCFALSALSYIWGDPVRGPFYGVLRPKAKDTFTVHAGADRLFSFKELAGGISLSEVVNAPPQPLEVWLKKTWWSGLRYRIVVKGQGGAPVVEVNNDSARLSVAGWDMNADDTAIEVVGSQLTPLVQVVFSSDYDVWINFALTEMPYTGNPKGRVLIVRGDHLEVKPLTGLRREDLPERVFKYPSYIYRGVRQ